MFVRRCYPYTFILLALVYLQQSCGTSSTVRAPLSAPAPEAASTVSPVAEIRPEFLLDDDEGAIAFEFSLAPPVKSILPESILAEPEKDRASIGTKYDTVVLARTSETPPDSAWEYRQNQQGKIVGFEFSNRGGNRILPQRYNVDKNLFFTRDFQFRFDERARQDMHLWVTDWAPSRDRQFRLSELMNSVIVLFPRHYVPAIFSSIGRSVVTLPTGEDVEFDGRTHEILGGAFSEAPVDLNPDKAGRKFARLEYLGKGLAVRADARGTDPRVGTVATITAGEPAATCEGAACKTQCRVPSKELWEQTGAFRFKFPTDEEFNLYLRARCGFGIPKVTAESVIASIH